MGDPGNPVFFRSKAISGKGLFFPAQVGQILTIPSTNKLFRPPTKGIPAERMFDPPQGGTDTVFWSFLSCGSSDQADSFCNESEISCHRFRHPTKGIPAERMFDPPQRGDRHCFREFSQP